MSDILRQVDEELRKDRLLNLWKRYRIYLIGGLILLISSVLGYQINKSINHVIPEFNNQYENTNLVDMVSTKEVIELNKPISDKIIAAVQSASPLSITYFGT